MDLTPAYIIKLPTHPAVIILKTRSHMIKIRTNMKTKNPKLNCRWCKQYQMTQDHMITECTMTADIDIDLNKAVRNHKDTCTHKRSNPTHTKLQAYWTNPQTQTYLLDLQAQTSLTDT